MMNTTIQQIRKGLPQIIKVGITFITPKDIRSSKISTVTFYDNQTESY